MGKNNSLRYVAGACFAGEAVLYLIYLVDGASIWSLLSLAGCVLIAVSMFASLPGLTSAGAGACAVNALRQIIFYLVNIRYIYIYI